MSVRNQPGFTVFEMMIVVAIAALVSAFAIPAFQETLAKSRVNGTATEISDAMVTARNLAISKRRPLTLEMSGAEWGISQATTSGALVALHRGTLNPAATVVWPVTQLTFDANGRVTQAAPAAVPVPTSWTVSVCDTASRRELGRNVTVSRVGRIQSSNHAGAGTCNP